MADGWFREKLSKDRQAGNQAISKNASCFGCFLYNSNTWHDRKRDDAQKKPEKGFSQVRNIRSGNAWPTLKQEQTLPAIRPKIDKPPTSAFLPCKKTRSRCKSWSGPPMERTWLFPKERDVTTTIQQKMVVCVILSVISAIAIITMDRVPWKIVKFSWYKSLQDNNQQLNFYLIRFCHSMQ